MTTTLANPATIYSAGPRVPTPSNTVPVHNRFSGEFVRPTFYNLDGPGIKTTLDLSRATHYMPEDVPAVLAYLGPGWEAAT
jgi:hypothetical protein